MKKITIRFFFQLVILLFALLLVGCNDDSTTENYNSVDTETGGDDETEEVTESKTSDQETGEEDYQEDTDQTVANDDSEADTNESSTEENNDSKLANYSAQEIEYARVWLNFGPNQDVEELYVTYIAAGTLLNLDEDDIDVSYPEDVIQIRGSRIVDGVITYSGNGDGTINVYKIPYRWYGGNPRPDELEVDKIIDERNDIMNNTELVYIEPGDDQTVIDLIHKITTIDQ